MQQENIYNDLLTLNQCMAYMKCSNVFIWKLRKEGLLTSLHAGKKILITKSSIDNYLKLNTPIGKKIN